MLGKPAVALLALLLFPLAAHAALTHRYSFNNGTANDSVGSANATLQNGATVTGGKLTFSPATNNGINTSVATGQYAQLPIDILHTSDFTIESWFTNTGGNSWQRILDVGISVPSASGGTQGQGFIIFTENGFHPLGQVSIATWGGAGDTNFLAAPNPYSLGVEHQMVYTFSKTNSTEALYLDGALLTSGSTFVDPSTTNYSSFYIGRSQFTADPFFAGSIDELRTYNNSLTASQVLLDFQGGPNAVPEPASLTLLLLGSALIWRGRPARGRRA